MGSGAEILPGVTTIRRRRPHWLRRRIPAGGLSVEVRFTAAERRVYRRRPRLPVSVWAERHRWVEMTSEPGWWKNRRTPYLVGVMDAAGASCVETVILCKAPQIGGTEAAHNFVGWAIDSAPGPVIYVFPDSDTAKENSKDRILPLIRDCKELRKYLTGVADDAATLRINLTHMPIYLAWATSASRLGNKPARYVVLDEVDKYPQTAGKREASPIDLAEKRVTTYRGLSKIWKISTPTIELGNIWRALNEEAHVIFDYWVVCPLCGERQLMSDERISAIGEEKDPTRIEAELLGVYSCSGCGGLWDDVLRDRAVRDGGWWSRGEEEMALPAYMANRRPQKVGFHMPAWISSFISLSKVLGAKIRAKGDKEKLKDYANNYQAKPWKDHSVERKEDQILALRDDRVRGMVPRGPVRLTVAIDTQDKGFFYEVRAWGYGFKMESWQVREGFVETWEALEEVVFGTRYEDPDGVVYPILGGFIDSGGHRTAEVYDWCRINPIIKAIKGKSSGRGGAPVVSSHIDYYPGTKKRIPGGLTIYLIDTHHFKDQLAGKLEIKPDDPGAWHLHSETDESYAAQMCAEYRDERENWQCPRGRANHFWDVSVYQLAYVEYDHFKFKPEPGKEVPQAPKQKSVPRMRPTRRRW